MKHFGKIVFNYFCKYSILNLWQGSEYMLGFKYVRVLNIGKYDRVLNIRRDTIMEEFWIMKYDKVVNIPGIYRVLNMPE